MKKNQLAALILAVAVLFSATDALAGAPFNNLEGVGGVAFNPLAYPADSSGKDSHLKIGDTDVLGKARFGAWYISLGDADIDWTAVGVADTFFNRLEVSYGYQSINKDTWDGIHKSSIGAKLLLVQENLCDIPFVPAVSVGAIFKDTSHLVLADADDTGSDFYLVATKLITQLPRPVLLSGGVLSTNSRATGALGYDDDEDTTFFGNIDIILPAGLILGFEYKEGAKFDKYEDESYWDAHLAWTPSANLTLIAAHVDAGDIHSTSSVGLGEGVVLSAQYSF